MHTCGAAGRRWVALFAAALFVFQALIASSALAAPRAVSGLPGATTIICTASGPRVVALDLDAAKQGAGQHSGALPHCCAAGCAMLGGAALPALLALAWFVPAASQPDAPQLAATPHFSSALARSQQRSRAPPFLA
ncbi:DUF2946 family protein [Achromobacter sp. NPDC058515]|uniref:DUF2946 family protein n=1 Tax=Achromobacter sp. NPDC058515 TaxID=3346533 RepID=UPI0036639224